MTEIEQAVASLKHLVECRCDEAYTGRGRHDPYSACGYAYEVKIVADHVAAIEDKLATCEKYRDAYAECDRIGTQAVRDLEAKLAKAVEVLEQCEIMLRLRGHDEVAAIARATLAEIKGESQDGMG